MLPDMAWSQSKQSSAVGNWTTPLQTPSTAMTWNAFFLKERGGASRRVSTKPEQIESNLSERIWEVLCEEVSLHDGVFYPILAD